MFNEKIMERVISFLILLLFIVCTISFLVGLTGLIDSFTLEEIGGESVPCLDEERRPFENQRCMKTVTCSWLGFMGDERCEGVKNNGTIQKRS